MEPRSENDVKGIVEEMAEDRGRTMNRASAQKRGARGSSRDGTGRTLLFGGVAAVVLLAVLFLLLGQSDRGGDEAWDELTERMNRIDSRLDRLEGSVKQVPAVIGRMEGLGKSLSRLESDQRALSDRVDRISRRLEALSKRAPAETSPGPSATGQPATHTVQRGETLFSIAKRYGLSVEALSRLNGIGRNDVIQPGQQLIVGQGAGSDG